MGSRCSRQKPRLQSAQVAPAARTSRWGGSKDGEECDDSGIMVLFVKHVHLQKDGAARNC